MQELVFDETLHEHFVVLGWDAFEGKCFKRAVSVDTVRREVEAVELPDILIEGRSPIEKRTEIMAARPKENRSQFLARIIRVLRGEACDVLVVQRAQGWQPIRECFHQKSDETWIVVQVIFDDILPIDVAAENLRERIPDELLLDDGMRIRTQVEDERRVVRRKGTFHTAGFRPFVQADDLLLQRGRRLLQPPDVIMNPNVFHVLSLFGRTRGISRACSCQRAGCRLESLSGRACAAGAS